MALAAAAPATTLVGRPFLLLGWRRLATRAVSTIPHRLLYCSTVTPIRGSSYRLRGKAPSSLYRRLERSHEKRKAIRDKSPVRLTSIVY